MLKNLTQIFYKLSSQNFSSSYGFKTLGTLTFPERSTYINGKWVKSQSGKEFSVTNPSTGDKIADVPDCDNVDLDNAIQGAYEAFKKWRSTTAKERSNILRHMFDIQIEHTDSLAKIITSEMGKAINEAVAEIKYGAGYFEWFSEEARRIYGDIIPSPIKSKEMFLFKEPIGVAGIITPWNFPNGMITRKISAALAAGCTCVIKPPADSPLSALAVAKIAEMAGVPSGVINVITALSNTKSIGKKLCEDTRIATISFTGSTAVGKLLLQDSASTVKKVSLELGGNAPFIVFNSANISKAVAGLMASKFRNSGQTCVCTNRILVQEEIHDRFVAGVAEEMKQLVIGDGMDSKTTIGPLINENAVLKVDRHVKNAIDNGAELVLGGKINSRGKCFYEPTLLKNVTSKMLLCEEETFGPLAGVIKFKTEEEAIQIANSSRSGLAGYFYSENISQIVRVSKLLEVGMVGVNEGLISSPEVAFGGIKESGIGREGSRYGIDEYVQMKYVCLGGLDQ